MRIRSKRGITEKMQTSGKGPLRGIRDYKDAHGRADTRNPAAAYFPLFSYNYFRIWEHRI